MKGHEDDDIVIECDKCTWFHIVRVNLVQCIVTKAFIPL